MADRIVVDLGWVLDLKGSIDETVARMRADSDDAASLPSRPDVDSGTTDFMNRWDERRGNVADCIGGCAEMLGVIHESFTAVQDDLIAALNGEGG